jgi:hypothetical protein
MNWTPEEEKQLVETINRNIYQNSKRPIQWKSIKPMERHTIPGMQTRWAKNIQPNMNFNGYRYTPKTKTTKKKVETKRVKVSRSFFWGALKVTRYE